ncbi:MAG: MFS transporter [Mailhella sp.]|nr:MFS transporter [Mailhella sp.]
MRQPLPPELKPVIAALWTGNLFAPFLVSGVAAMLPAIGASLGASAVALSLVMACYNLGQGISHILSGRICGLLGVKRVLLIGMGLFCLFGMMLGLAPAMPFAIGMRFAQGLAAASISCCVTALSVSLAPPDRKGQVISTVVTAVYLGLAIGPFVCGGLTELVGWRTVFFLLAALGAVELWLLRRIIPADTLSASRRSFDVAGAALVTVSLCLITFGSTCTFLHPGVIFLLPLGLALLALFLRREWRSENPILDLRVLARVPDLPGGMAATFINYGAIMGLSVFFALYLQQVLGLNAFQAGMVMMTQSFTQMLLSPVAGRIADRYDPVRLSTFGMAGCGAAILALTLLDTNSPVWQVLLNQIALGAGIAFFVAPNVAATLGNVPKEQMPVASGLLGCLRTLGGLMSHILVAGTIGLFLGDAVVGPDNAERFMLAMRHVLVVFGGFNLLAMYFGIRRSISHGKG